MKTKIYLTLLICLSLMLLIGCDKKNINSRNSIITKPLNIDSQSNDNELLYGKYPEPILIAIGENSDVNKDYKELTRNDLKKIKSLNFESAINEYGFEENIEYDFSIVLEMPNLNTLSIDFFGSNIRLKDYSILNKLNNLESLSISNISDSDINHINSLDSLTWLSISYSSITKLDFLENFPQLELFSLTNINNIKNFDALRNLKEINQLDLWDLNMTEKELSTIPEMPTLIGLSLSRNNLTNITSLPKLQKLRQLVVESNPLESINVSSENVPGLKYLFLYNSSISDANKINGMDTLEEINIKNTKITRVAPFKRYKMLKNINATLANIEDKETFADTNIKIFEE